MRSPSQSTVDDDADNPITLGILNAVEEDSNLTQRSVANTLGIALGLANAYLKRCVRKGLIKVQQVPSNRYAYFLTPQGFAEKSRLTSEYLTSSFNFFRKARVECSNLMQECEDLGYKRIALVGVSDLSDVIALSALESKIAIAGIVDDSVTLQSYAGLRVAKSLEDLGPVDAIVVTALLKSQQKVNELRKQYPDLPLMAPPLLSVDLDGEPNRRLQPMVEQGREAAR